MQKTIILKISFILSFIISLIDCSRINNLNNTEEKNKQNYILYKKIINEIKTRTQNALKNLGIKKILFYNNGVWYYGGNTEIIFNKNGKIVEKYKNHIVREILWKINNNKISINPNFNNFREYFHLSIKAAVPSNYTVGPKNDPYKYLKQIQYVINVSGKYKSNKDFKTFNWGYNLKIFKIIWGR